jgi:hypothetical protein
MRILYASAGRCSGGVGRDAKALSAESRSPAAARRRRRASGGAGSGKEARRARKSGTAARETRRDARAW